MAKKLETLIENALMSRFSGLRCRFVINKDNTWDFKMLPGSKERFDELYPGMTREEADAQILEDMKAIISQYMPNTEFIGYERYGEYTHF